MNGRKEREIHLWMDGGRERKEGEKSRDIELGRRWWSKSRERER